MQKYFLRSEKTHFFLGEKEICQKFRDFRLKVEVKYEYFNPLFWLYTKKYSQRKLNCMEIEYFS